jgi:hypothetical protein
MANNEVRIQNLRILVSETGSIAKVAKKIDTSPAYLSQIINGVKSSTGTARGIGDKLARKLESGLHKPHGWLDNKQEENVLKQVEAEYKDEFIRQLLYFYNGMNLDHKEALIAFANQLYSIDNKNDRTARPYPNSPKKEKHD